MVNSIRHLDIIYKCLRSLNLCQVFSHMAIHHVIAVLISTFSLRYKKENLKIFSSIALAIVPPRPISYAVWELRKRQHLKQSRYSSKTGSVRNRLRSFINAEATRFPWKTFWRWLGNSAQFCGLIIVDIQQLTNLCFVNISNLLIYRRE